MTFHNIVPMLYTKDLEGTIDFYTKTLSTGSAAPEIRMRINYRVYKN